MSDENKKEIPVEDNVEENEPTSTYSQAFEEFERSKVTDKTAKLFFSILSTLSVEYQEEQAEQTRKLFNVADVFKKNIEDVMSTKEGRDLFKKEMELRIGKK
jgi:hypothetical protein